jgi:hypothetical protein
LEILKCRNAAFARVYWCVPEKTVADGLRTLRCDADIIAMINESATCKNILMYVDHSNFLETQKNFLERQNRDVAQVAHVDTSSQERKSTFVEGTSTSYQEGIEIEDGAEREVGTNSDADSDFIDNDYEFDIDDDDLFAQNMDDMLINDEANTKGKDLCTQEELEEGNAKDVGSTDLNLHTIDTNVETMNFNFRTFRADVDITTPIFKLGMVFANVKELRKAIDVYNIRERRQLWKKRNEKDRLEVYDKGDCPWKLKAAVDSMSKSMLVKRVC